jgi:heme exporter protein C
MNSKPTALKILDWVSIITLIFATYMVLIYAPMERVMGNVQRVFYFHVATGWVGFLSFFIAVINGILVLKKGEGNLKSWKIAAWITGVIGILAYGMYRGAGIEAMNMPGVGLLAVAAITGGVAYGISRKKDTLHWDTVAVAAVELGLMFSFINIVTGSIWARPIWNTWWTWDPRLVTATIMELIYFAYLMLRQGIENPMRRARFGAVYAIFGFVSVPISYMSIRIWRTIHPIVIGNGGGEEAMGSFSMTAPMQAAFFTSLIVFTIVFIDLFWHRVRLGKFQEKVESAKMKAML